MVGLICKKGSVFIKVSIMMNVLLTRLTSRIYKHLPVEAVESQEIATAPVISRV